jgi:hypothetical protein
VIVHLLSTAVLALQVVGLIDYFAKMISIEMLVIVFNVVFL